jgi:hypothetical protein
MTKAKFLLSDSAIVTSLNVGHYAFIRETNPNDTPRLLTPLIGIVYPDFLDKISSPKKTKIIYSEETHSIDKNFEKRDTYSYITIQNSDTLFWENAGFYTPSETIYVEENISNPILNEFKASREKYLDTYLSRRTFKDENEKEKVRARLVNNIPVRLLPFFIEDKHQILFLHRLKFK